MRDERIEELFISSEREDMLRDLVSEGEDYLRELIDLCDELEGLS